MHVHDDPDPEPPPPPTGTVNVNSIAALHSALAVDANVDITLAPGTYSGGLYFDARFAARTKTAVIRLAGVTLTGGGLTFRGGAHDLEVLDPTFANWTVNQTGVLMFGGWDEAPAHHITVRGAKVLSSVRRTSEGHTTDHGAYFSHSRGGVHDVLIEDLAVDATNAMGLASGVHMDHADGGLVNAYNVTVRRLVFKGNGSQGRACSTRSSCGSRPLHDWLFDGATITNANGYPIGFESRGAADIVFKDIVSTGSRYPGFYGSMGANPARRHQDRLQLRMTFSDDGTLIETGPRFRWRVFLLRLWLAR